MELSKGNTVVVAHERWAVEDIRKQGSIEPFRTVSRVTVRRGSVTVSVLVPHAVVTRARLVTAIEGGQ
ncbi:hypothetical protein P755_gp117 [Mycobacterium phage Quink]|nr:hypothetical protein PBI_MURPHY_141 [Mycobacterium phage Murphy]YP_008531220.1 hypothetical protein P755_gp117 [Mycobacterium phage Quink]APU02945.1 hypothetical protein SEA_CRYSTALP_141 [Mycobacterium phage CrystalP]AVO23615.1 hypothetical protein SEA_RIVERMONSTER_141 [Mycobacterium phage RiverMonster]QGJ92387.1 hypothetical protein SEA_ORIONPAX_138 [Mycobacterium phage OrionPax]QGJ94668.1 hypothetical protein SEA_GOOBERAZURE_144 [Mycobacterium phage GooberAzure]QZD96836.1 hypothetical pr